MEGYRAASYQRDIIDELARQAKVYYYGPGFNGYDRDDSIDEVLAKVSFEPDAIIVGHAWLSDDDGNEVDPHPRLELEKTALPKVAIINKEYVNLDAKLEYVNRNRFDIAFTHHHDINRYSEVTGIEFIFWPFAFDPRIFDYDGEEKTIDVGFSGILQNLNKNARQSDIRAMIMKRFFFTIFDVPIAKRKAFQDVEIFWNSISRKKTGKYLSQLLNKRQYLKSDDYAKMMRKTKIYINTLSPMGLVSPRFFECMASQTLIFCEESELYQNFFTDDLYVTYKKDLSDFREKLLWILSDQSTRNKITDKAFKYVYANHTWEKRVSLLLTKISHNSLRKITKNPSKEINVQAQN